MAHSQETKDALRKSYIFDGQSLALAAALNDVSYGTAQRWKKSAQEAGDDWDKVKSARTMAGGSIEDLGRQILTKFIVEFDASMDAIANTPDLAPPLRVEMLTSLSDAFNKAISANKKILPQTSELATGLEVLELLTEYIREHKPELLKDFSDVLIPFGVQLEKRLK